MSPLDGEALPFSKSAQLARGDRRYHRKVASAKRWQQIIDAKGSVCRLCLFVDEQPKRAAELGLTKQGCEGLPAVYHHLLDRVHGGSDCEGNVLPLGGLKRGNEGHHGAITLGREPERRALAEALWDIEIAYLAERVGEAWPEIVFGVVYRAA